MIPPSRGGSRRVGKYLQESILIALDFIWKVLLSDQSYRIFLFIYKTQRKLTDWGFVAMEL